MTAKLPRHRRNAFLILKPLSALLRQTGAGFILMIGQVGSIFRFAVKALLGIFPWPFYGRLLTQQLVSIGYYSLPVVGLTTLFSGMVMALQTYTGFSGLGAESTLPRVVSIAMVRELAPVLAGLMLAGRVGASMTAELGTMRVTEQIDALHTLGVNPMQYLVAPRIVACTIALPLLVAIGDSIGIFGGYIVAVYKLGLQGSNFINHVLDSLQWIGVLSGLTKAAIFGFLLSLIGCYFGFYSRGGAAGVGVSTTNAVVVASILILMSNFLITEVFFQW